MILATTVLSFFALLAPQESQSGSPAPGQDLIRLRIGSEVVGRIVQETADYVEIEISPGNVVGFDKARTSSIVRAELPVAGAERPSVANDNQTHRDEWNVLHDGEGRVVGWLHATVTRGEQDEIRIGEEWRIRQDDGTVELTMLDILDADGKPRSSFYHERLRPTGDDRVRDERLVRAVVENGELHVRRRSTKGDDDRDYNLPDGVRFPLELREELRRRPAGSHSSETHQVYDPCLEEFARQSFDLGRVRRIEGDKGETRVRVLTTADHRGRNAEWLDAAARPLRRELNGPSLVAVPSSEDSAKRLMRRNDRSFPSAFATDPDGRFGLWLPNPGWEFIADPAEGTISARARLDEASVSVVRLDHLDPELMLPTAADAVSRWLNLVQPGLKIVERSPVRVRNSEAICLRGRYEVIADRRVREFELITHVFTGPDGNWHAISGCAPRETYAQISDDLDWILERVELRREGFDPKLQGPLAAPR